MVKRIPNPYQVVYEDGSAWRTIHVNHAKPTKLPAAAPPAPTPTPEPPRPALGYLPKSLQRPIPRQPPPPPQSAAPTGGSPSPPTSSVSTLPAASPSAGQRPTRGTISANKNSAPRSSEPRPPVPARANENSGSGFKPRRSARLNPQAYAIKNTPKAPAPQSLPSETRLPFNQCLGVKEDPYSFSSVYLEDLRNGEAEYLMTVQHLIEAIPKTLDPASRFVLRGQVTPSGHQRLRHSMRAALWWLLPSDGDFRRASSGLHYYLARQGRCVVLRGGDVTQPVYESRMNWVHDPAPPTFRRPILEFADTPAPDIASESPGAPFTQPKHKKSRRRRRRRTNRAANQNSAHRSTAPVTPDERWTNENSASQSATRPKSAANDLPKMRSTPVYHPQSFHSSHLPQPPIPAANENSAFPFGLDRCGIPGVYKPAQADPRQDSTATLTRDNISGFGLSSPSLLQPCTKPFSGLPSRRSMTSPTREAGDAARERPGIVYPLLPRAARPDTRVVIEAALPEAAALDRRAQPPIILEIDETSLPQSVSSPRQRPTRRQSRKRRRNRSTGIFRPPKRSSPQGRWCE